MYKQLTKLIKPRLPAGALTMTFVIYITLPAGALTMTFVIYITQVHV